MRVPIRHIRFQGEVLATLGKTALSSFRRKRKEGQPKVPGLEFVDVVSPRDPKLVRDFIAHVGGDPEAYGKVLPAHFFPQWGFPLLSRTLDDLPYDLTKVLNAGSSLKILHQLPMGEPLYLRARLENVDDNGKRAILTQRLITGTLSHPDSLVVEQTAIVPLKRKGSSHSTGGNKTEDKKKAKEKASVSAGARELARIPLEANVGIEFALLTGDFNPLHWVAPYAKAAGFRSPILHGFSSMSRAIETLNRELFGGDIRALKEIRVRFVNPILVPSTIGVYVDEDQLFVGDGPGYRAYLAGSFK